jgi:hypothetical protein
LENFSKKLEGNGKVGKKVGKNKKKLGKLILRKLENYIELSLIDLEGNKATIDSFSVTGERNCSTALCIR